MGNLSDFNADTAPAANDYAPLPAGEYVCAATSCELRNTKDLTGSYFHIEWQVIEGAGKGRKIFDNMTFTNKNQTAQDIGRGMLAAWMRVAGKPKAADTSELIGLPVRLKVKVEQREGWDPQNKVVAIKALGPAGSAPAAAPVAAAASDSVPF